MELLAFAALYLSMSALSVQVWYKFNAWQWKENWTRLTYEQVYDDDFVGLAVIHAVAWPLALPVLLLMWSVERI